MDECKPLIIGLVTVVPIAFTLLNPIDAGAFADDGKDLHSFTSQLNLSRFSH